MTEPPDTSVENAIYNDVAIRVGSSEAGAEPRPRPSSGAGAFVQGDWLAKRNGRKHTRKVLHELLGLGGEDYDELLGLGIVRTGRTDAEGSGGAFSPAQNRLIPCHTAADQVGWINGRLYTSCYRCGAPVPRSLRGEDT